MRALREDDVVLAVREWATRAGVSAPSKARLAALREGLASLGAFGLSAAERFGGTALDRSVVIAVAAEVAQADAVLAVEVALTSLVSAPVSEQLSADETAAIVRGERVVAVALPERASNPRRAIAPFGASVPRWLVEVEEGSWALIPSTRAALAGSTLGLDGLDAVLVDAAIPANAELGSGIGALTAARLAIACAALGTAAAALDAGRRYADERVQFGRPIRVLAAIEDKLVESHVHIEAARALLIAAAAGTDPDATHAARASTAAAWLAAHHAVQIHGGYGYTKDFPVERHLRDAIALRAWLGEPHPTDPALFAL